MCIYIYTSLYKHIDPQIHIHAYIQASMYCRHLLYRNVCIYFFFSHSTFGPACDAGESIVLGTNDNFPYIYLYTGTHRKASRLKRQVSASYTTQREASRFKRHFSASCHTHRNIQQRKASLLKRQFPALHRNTQRKASPLKRQSPAQHRNTQRRAFPLKRHSPALHRGRHNVKRFHSPPPP